MSKGGFDYNEFKQFANNFENLKNEHFVEQFLQRTANELMAEVKRKQTGHIGEQYRAVDTGDMVNAWELSGIRRNGNDLEITISNPKEYASFVEYGHWQEAGRFVPGHWEGNRFVYEPGAKEGMVLKKSWVEGHFMLTISMQEIERQLPARLSAAWEQYAAGLIG